ncbi:MAG: hypothetical protein JXA08_04160 [Methanomicrobiaceae archaeon]|nr:hypothetical protein [Methanomicrobiaceae archaeon]
MFTIPSLRFITLCIAAILLISPASAFTADTFTIEIADSGDADMTFEYSLSWIEYIAVYLQITDPTEELTTALSKYSEKPAQVISTSDNALKIQVFGFAKSVATESGIAYTTPTVSFTEAQQILDEYWFAPLLNPDFSPAISTVRFPEGYEAVYTNQLEIPGITHEVIA